MLRTTCQSISPRESDYFHLSHLYKRWKEAIHGEDSNPTMPPGTGICQSWGFIVNKDKGAVTGWGGGFWRRQNLMTPRKMNPQNHSRFTKSLSTTDNSPQL